MIKIVQASHDQSWIDPIGERGALLDIVVGTDPDAAVFGIDKRFKERKGDLLVSDVFYVLILFDKPVTYVRGCFHSGLYTKNS